MPLRLSITFIAVGSIASILESKLFIESQFYLGTYLIVAGLMLISNCRFMFNHKVFHIMAYIGYNLSLYVYIIHIAVGKSWDLFASRWDLTDSLFYNNVRALAILSTTLLISWTIYKIKCIAFIKRIARF